MGNLIRTNPPDKSFVLDPVGNTGWNPQGTVTAQQFQRAAGLICALEHLRKNNREELGEAAFSIGIWLGAATTPNTRADARAALRSLSRGEDELENPFVITKCPWCSSVIGPVLFEGKVGKGLPRIFGYELRGNTVAITCADQACEFHAGPFAALQIYISPTYTQPSIYLVKAVQRRPTSLTSCRNLLCRPS